MAYLMTNIFQDTLLFIGREACKVTTATDGSATTAIDTKLEDSLGEDDSVKGGTLIVVRDAGGAGAAPEGEMQRISGYVRETNVITVDTAFSGTSAIATGDTIMVGAAKYPMRDLIQLLNLAMKWLGDIVLTETSLTTADSQTEYAWGVDLKRRPPLQIQIQTVTDSDDNRWESVLDWYATPAAPGSAGLNILTNQPASGYSLKRWYETTHPALTAWNSIISETIPPRLAMMAMVMTVLRWYGPRSDLEINKYREAAGEFMAAKAELPIWRPESRSRFFHSRDW